MNDPLEEIAPYYDRIMEHVNYDRWLLITTELAALVPRPFHHLDAACGTGTLLKQLRRAGWTSCGIDLSRSMLRSGRQYAPPFPAAVADLRALPFPAAFNYVTCLFDSINFLLEPEDLRRACNEISRCLAPEGLFYFDAVTEKMVTQHFEGQAWVENNGRFTTQWASEYCRKTGIVETRIRINRGPLGIVRERIYLEHDIVRAVEDAGLTVLGVHDAHTWKSVKGRTVRMDFVAAKAPGARLRARFDSFQPRIRALLT